MRWWLSLGIVILVAASACKTAGKGQHARKFPATTQGSAPSASQAPSSAAPVAAPVPQPDAPATAASTPLVTAPGTSSRACIECHDVAWSDWKSSRHAVGLRPASAEDLDMLSTMIQCADLPATHVLGGHHQLRFLTEDTSKGWSEGRWLALPCAWNVHETAVNMLNETTWEQRPWESSCAACHTTNFRAKDHGFAEAGIGCERCHGDGSRHLESLEAADILGFAGRSARDEIAVCASCHLQDGVSKTTGLKFPHDYQPGDDLFADFEFDWTVLDQPDPKRALDVHQKLVIRNIVRDGDDSLRCTTCHEVHATGHARHQKLPVGPFCSTCHLPDMKLKEYSVSCNVCQF